MDTKDKNYAALKKLAAELGAVAFGVCGIKEEKENFNLSADALEGLDYAVSIAVGLSKRIMAEIKGNPTKLYFHHYRQANNLLDHISMRLSGFVQGQGFNALPVPASQIVDWEKQTAHLSHKKIAQLAGMGFLGRHNLIVHPEHGAFIRLATVLTDMPLKTDKPLKADCGECVACAVACPAGAIKKSQDAFDHLACYEKLKFFQKQRFADQYICGICIKACLPARQACLPNSSR
ncbi:MAG: epoxyqueuosine reductase [Candidatus Omnitrophica bacterium]|nr:epoxyqueuosine reductase [Candidatus Omnitrophota bacterium]